MGDDVSLEGALVVEVEVLRLLGAGKQAARMRLWPPWSWRDVTSRSRQAVRNSVWVHPSVRASFDEPFDGGGQ